MDIRDLITKLNNVLVINKLDPKDEATIGEAIVGLDDLRKQIDRLAQFIMDEIPGEPSENEGAIDCAIRVMTQSFLAHEHITYIYYHHKGKQRKWGISAHPLRDSGASLEKHLLRYIPDAIYIKAEYHDGLGFVFEYDWSSMEACIRDRLRYAGLADTAILNQTDNKQHNTKTEADNAIKDISEDPYNQEIKNA